MVLVKLTGTDLGLFTYLSGLPRWFSSEEPTCQFRRYGFDPWVRKIPWRRKRPPTPVFLPGKSNGQRSSVGYSPWGHKGVRHNWASMHTHMHLPFWQVKRMWTHLSSIFIISHPKDKLIKRSSVDCDTCFVSIAFFRKVLMSWCTILY